jgi:Outer membrane protein beta-barrel domain
MRRFLPIAFFGLSLLVVGPAFAGPIGIHPGFKVGLTVANFDENFSTAAELESQSKMTFGGSLRLDVASFFSIQPELQYLPGGAKGSFVVDNGGTPTTVDGILKTNYLEMPLLAKFRFPGAGSLIPNLYLAPSAAVNLTSRLQGDLSSVGGSPTETDVKDEMQKLLFGGAVGGGFDMRAGKGIVTLDARYSRSLSDIFKGATTGGAAGFFSASDSKSSNLSVTLGYAF